MGQYIGIYNRTKKEFIAGIPATIKSCSGKEFEVSSLEGAKLIEHIACYGDDRSKIRRLVYLLATTWKGDDLVVQGDYAKESDPKFISEEELEGFSANSKRIPKSFECPRYFIGKRKCENDIDSIYYIDSKKYPNIFVMILLALYNSNGRGGGDIYFNESLSFGTHYLRSFKSLEHAAAQGMVKELTEDFLSCYSFALISKLPAKAWKRDCTDLAATILSQIDDEDGYNLIDKKQIEALKTDLRKSLEKFVKE